MAQHRRCGLLDVVRQQEVAAVERRTGLRHQHQADGRAGACAHGQQRPLPCPADQLRDVIKERGLDADGADFALRLFKQAGRGPARSGPRARVSAGGVVPFKDGALILQSWIIDAELEQEAVQLRLGQRVGALEVDRVLGGEDGEVRAQGVADAVDGDLALFHALKQGGLGARGHAVDLVDEQKAGEDGALVQHEFLRAGAEDVGAEDVGGHEVRGRLHTMEVEPQPLAEQLDSERFGDAGHAPRPAHGRRRAR